MTVAYSVTNGSPVEAGPIPNWFTPATEQIYSTLEVFKGPSSYVLMLAGTKTEAFP